MHHVLTDIEKSYCAVFGRLHGALNRPDGGIHLALAACDILSFCDDVAWSLVPDHIKDCDLSLLQEDHLADLQTLWAASEPAYARHCDLVFLMDIATEVIRTAGERIADQLERPSSLCRAVALESLSPPSCKSDCAGNNCQSGAA